MLLKSGENRSEIAQQLNLSYYTVRRVYQRYQEIVGCTGRRGSGRKCIISQRDDRYCSLRYLNALQLAQNLQEVQEINISWWTVRGCFAEEVLTTHRSVHSLILTAAYRQARPQLTREHVN